MYIIGASGHAKAVIAALESKGMVITGVMDDNPDIKKCLHYTVFQPGKNPFFSWVGFRFINLVVKCNPLDGE